MIRLGPRPISLLLLTLTGLAWPSPIAWASSSEEEDERGDQTWALEIKFGPFTPAIDEEFGNEASPYADIFGDRPRVMAVVELDWQVWSGLGIVGPALSIGYSSASARPLAAGSSSPGQRIGGKTSISFVPISVLAVYRFDVLARRYSIPLVPNIKAGANYTFWWINSTDGIAQAKGEEGKGGSWMWHLSAGLSIELDMIDWRSAKSLRDSTGVYHSHLFIEVVHLENNAIGREAELDCGGTTFLVGLAIEF